LILLRGKMKKVATLIFCLFALASFSFAQSGKVKEKNLSKCVVAKNSSNVFYPTRSLFKWMLGDKLIVDTEIVPVSITSLDLSRNEIENLPNNSSNPGQRIDVTAEACNPKDLAITYYYVGTVGKIIGEGAKVSWDLTGVKPGKYAISSAVDDGCGFCGDVQTKTVTVK
jgi:hypothetical protein